MGLLSEGYLCTCGMWNDFSTWVYSNWAEDVIVTCKKCKRHHHLYAGKIQNDPKLPSDQ